MSKNAGRVALRKESVDRNKRLGLLGWLRTVALRKESVDRNANFEGFFWWVEGSLSARREWIEILKIGLMLVVSLGRSPQGERG